jgi:hypothetical protein
MSIKIAVHPCTASDCNKKCLSLTAKEGREKQALNLFLTIIHTTTVPQIFTIKNKNLYTAFNQ